MLETLALRRALLCGGLHLAQSAISSNVCWGLSVKECLLYSPKRTYVTTTGMSALYHKRTLAGVVADNKRPPGGHEQLPKSPITIERPTNNDCAYECPEYVEPSVRVAISEAEQRTKYSRE
jgi:hypothetical protein